MRIVFTGPEDARVIPGFGEVERGVPFDCPDGLAGRVPSKRWLELQLVDIPEAIAALDHKKRCLLVNELIGEDAGVGLLAQWPTFDHVAVKASKAAPADDGGAE